MTRSLQRSTIVLIGLCVGVADGASALAQTSTPGAASICGEPIPRPAAQPAPGSAPVIYQIIPCFERQGSTSAVEPETYLYYIHTRPSIPSQGTWVTFDESARQSLVDDFRRLWNTSFLDDLEIDAEDYVFDNGTVGKLIVFQMQERPRVRNVTYTGSKSLDAQAIQNGLHDRGVDMRLDTFVDEGV